MEEIVLPPHLRCASHTMNLIMCTDVEKWLLSTPETKAVYRNATTKCTGLWNKASRSTVASELVEDNLGKKLLVPCTTRWNSFYDALARVSEIPIVELNTLLSKLQMKAISEREYLVIREYCTVMKPLTMALDVLQGEKNCFYGTLLPTLQSLMHKTLELKKDLQILVGLPDAIVQSIRTRFAGALASEDAVLAAVTLPKFKLRSLHGQQERKDAAKASLIAECRKLALAREQQSGTTNPTPQQSTEEDFFSFPEDEDTYGPAESEVADYFKSVATEMDSLNQYPLIKKLSLKYNAATPSSAPVERLFSLGGLILSPKRNRLSDQKFERLLLLRYNHWFES
ncbi:uncharacterized protein LOC133454792 [Cololabis saira]|uniref:uncharacterized protein LOC133420810 n=1 Tax=Cololabis saira TaxID=129043 RepID=UPI002AD48ED0|nr:uncharacterized protein LOC133420810 [Cololabis saira]XP_061571178.1 uncharacterized protein LOC133424526 [Cololabis saira]XP_061589499.1 uncharacterized protein LOC133454792 [Cololabis saira]